MVDANGFLYTPSFIQIYSKMTSEQDQGSSTRVGATSSNGNEPRSSQLNTKADTRPDSGSAHRMFDVQEVLGTGSEGVIYRAKTSKQYKGTDKDEVAIKTVRLNGISTKKYRFLLREIAVHRAVQSHPHICGFHNFFKDRDHAYMILEFLKGDDLLSALGKTRKGFDECTSMAIIRQLLDALSYLHDRGIAHRDIKPENIMLSDSLFSRKRKELEVKLIDFGLCCYRELSVTGTQRLSIENVGTIRYAAPEIMKDEPYLPEQADIWSTGITLYTILTRTNPFLGVSTQEVLKHVNQKAPLFASSSWDKISPRTKTLIAKMLSIKPDDRPTAKEAFEEAGAIIAELTSLMEDESNLVQEEASAEDGLLPRRKKERSIAEKLHTLAESTEADEEIQKESEPETIFGRIKSFIMSFANGNESGEDREETE